MYYVVVNNGLIISQNKNILQETYGNFKKLPDDYSEDKYFVVEGELQLNPDYEAEQERKEKERIAQLNMTRGDFIEGLILALGKDENDVIALIETLPITDVEKKVYINRVKNALDFYRGYPVIDVLCGYLGLTTEQMTQFFETKDYKHLIPIEEENESTTDIQENTEA